MTAIQRDLSSLFRKLDDWFDDISLDEPISQFILGSDRAKLALIGRTTGNWFKTLTEPQLSDIESEDGYDDEEEPEQVEEEIQFNTIKEVSCKGKKRKIQTRSKKSCSSKNSIKQNHTIDSMAKNLELILDDHFSTKQDSTLTKEHEEPEVHFYTVYNEEDLALLDDTLGHCCTVSNSKREPASSPTLYVQPKIVDVSSSMEVQQGSYSTARIKADDLQVQTLMPLDHDYISKPQTKPLVMSNKLTWHNSKNVRQTRSSSSVLISEAIKRFARFSDEFRVLSIKHQNKR